MPFRPLPESKDAEAKSKAPSREARDQAAQYIAQMAAELAEMAETAQLDLLSYFLKMAQTEAETFLRHEE